MAEKVIIEDGIVVPVASRIKNVCKKRKDELRVSYQQISDGIMDMFGIDIPIGTVANFFAERSKASSVYTTGYICAYLGVSLDEQFGIKAAPSAESATETTVLRERIMWLEKESRSKDTIIMNLEMNLESGIKDRRSMLFACAFSSVILAAIAMWYVAMDLSVPHSGFFQPGAGYPVVGIITICIVAAAVVTAITLAVKAGIKKRKDLKK